ncbi:MAG: helix-turn-helix domain-containing protein [Roseburia sp.]|nr:helix-turn-helix domain-containing protein [Roseburia sp.]
MTLGDRIKIERNKISLSQAALGERLQITQQAVGRWEKNLSEPDTATLKKLAEIFNITLDELLGYAISPDERAAGASSTRKTSITPIEDELLYAFRKLGKKYGESTQRGIIDMIEKML